jgi:hypothetical protein
MIVLNFVWFLTNLSAQNPDSSLSPNGTDPSEPRTRFDAYFADIEPLASGYILQAAASADWAFCKWGSVGLQVPLVYANFPSTVTTEIGDIQLNTLLAFYRNKNEGTFKVAALGCNFFMNTGDVETGTGFGQYVIVPYLTASFYPAEEIMITPIVEKYFSLNEDDSNRSINDLSTRINTTLTIEELWITVTPELLIDLSGDLENLWTLRSSIGYMINPQMGFSAEVISQLAGEKRYNYLGRIAMRYLFN